jgi:hypothetical protein
MKASRRNARCSCNVQFRLQCGHSDIGRPAFVEVDRVAVPAGIGAGGRVVAVILKVLRRSPSCGFHVRPRTIWLFFGSVNSVTFRYLLDLSFPNARGNGRLAVASLLR